MATIILYLVLFGNVLIILGFWLWDHLRGPSGNLFATSWMESVLACGRLAGLLAVCALLLQLVLAGRVKWVERVFGLDRLFRVHHWNGFAVIALALTHPVLLTTGYAWRDEVAVSLQVKRFLLNFEDVWAAAVALVIGAVVIVLSVPIMTRRLKYEWWYAVHVCAYLVVLMAFGHQFAGGMDLTVNRWFAGYWYALYGFVLANVLWFRFLRPLTAFGRQRFRVGRLVAETADVTSLYITGRHLERFRAVAGQFVIVRFLAKGFWWQAHPFSISAVPNGQEIRLTIKQLGDFTRRIPELTPGTAIVIDGPHGLFTAARSSRSKVLAIAGGIGITPIRAVVQDLLATGREIVLLYGNRNRDSIAFNAEFRELAARQPRLRVVHVLSLDPGWGGEEGLIDKEKITRLAPDVAERDVYLCGPPPMMAGVMRDLKALGVPRQRIFYERFAL